MIIKGERWKVIHWTVIKIKSLDYENKVCSTNRWFEKIDLKIVGFNRHTFIKC